jgi:apolipoprotein N-acyltransferase
MASAKENLSLSSLARRKPYGLVLLSGILLAASFPPSPCYLLIYVAFVPLLVLFEPGIVAEKGLEDAVFYPFKRIAIVFWRLITLQPLWRKGMGLRGVSRYEMQEISGNAQLFRYSYAALFVWNAICCYWLGLTAFQATNFAEAMANAVAGILAIALNPLLMAIPFQLLARMRHRVPMTWAVLAWACYWLTFEFLHMNWELSWPWLTLGNALSYHPEWIQYAEYTGVLGVSTHILLVNVLVYVLLRQIPVRRRGAWAGALATVIVFVMGFPLYESGRLTSPSRSALYATDSLHVRLIQPNIDPYPGNASLTAEEQIEHYRRLILSQPVDSGTVVILPERAIPLALEPRTMLRGRALAPLWDIVDSFHVQLLTGLDDYEDFQDTADAPISARENYRIIDGKRTLVYTDYYNSAWVMQADRNTQVYRKAKLVPMVERVPFLRGLRILKFLNLDPAKGISSYGRPDSMGLLMTGDSIPTQVMICYESAFGDHTRQKTALGAQWIAMITNDGWWGNSSGYVQHAGLSVLRAIENRRAIARCANNGRSMIVGADGQVTQETDWWTEAVIDAAIPLYTYETFYVRHGDYLGWGALAMTALLLSVSGFLRLRARQKSLIESSVEDV